MSSICVHLAASSRSCVQLRKNQHKRSTNACKQRLSVRMVATGAPYPQTRLSVPSWLSNPQWAVGFPGGVPAAPLTQRQQRQGGAEEDEVPVWDPLQLGVDANMPGATTPQPMGEGEAVQYLESRRARQSVNASSFSDASAQVDWGNFFKGQLPSKLGTMLLLLAISRVGVYVPIDGVDRQAFADSLGSGGLLGYVDTLSGGSISKLGLFSLGIVPFINSSIIFQLLASAVPQLQKLQKEEGLAGRRKFNQLQRYGALAFAVVQAIGQVLYVRPYVDDFSLGYLASSSLTLTAGAMILMYIGEVLTELKLGNGTSLLIFVNIVAALPTSIGQTLETAGDTDNTGGLALFALAFIAVTMGIVYVQEADRKIPINYASRYKAGGLSRSSYLPFKVNSAGVMPIIFASSLLALPVGLANFTGSAVLANGAKLLFPGGPLYLPVNVGLICFFNYFYTFLQLDPKDVSDQLKRQGASIPSVRPGRATAQYITTVLERLSILGSGFLGVLAVVPGAVEALTHLETFRGFGGTSVLILVGVATDTARRVKSELVIQEYDKLDDFYK